MMDIRALCVYCGSSSKVRQSHLQAARALGSLAAQAEVEIVYGGGRVGLMGAVAEGAMAAGGRVVGIIPQHLEDLEAGNRAASEYIAVQSMHARKQLMAERSDAFCALPGGLGTLDETFEIITWRQLKLHDKPVILVNIEGFWDPLLRLIEYQTAEGYLRGATGLFHVVERVDQVLEAATMAPRPSLPDKIERM
ncbi:MAG: TIGR00730 family Rossman fold protein [Kiloniellaceae bacterium]|nr:TIGR00730 family Rossman fold protein [Kiloniellaceae bacterium]